MGDTLFDVSLGVIKSELFLKLFLDTHFLQLIFTCCFRLNLGLHFRTGCDDNLGNYERIIQNSQKRDGKVWSNDKNFYNV